MSHYSIGKIDSIEDLKSIFPEGEANDLNFVLFSTSGVHGSYLTIEDIDDLIDIYEEGGDDTPELTVLLVHPRLVCLRYGNISVTKGDIDFLKKLRASSSKVASEIGFGPEDE